MAYDLSQRLVIGLASSALFDLTESDSVFKAKGETAYRKYQNKNEHEVLPKGVAFDFIKRLLKLNELAPEQDPIVEVILMSRNDPDTGMRVMNSIEHYGLNITRAMFLQGRSPYQFIPKLGIKLFLTANLNDVKQAIKHGYPAGHIQKGLQKNTADTQDDELRLAFDFDGVIVDDEAETVYQTNDLEAFKKHETQKVDTPHKPGPLKEFLEHISLIQKLETAQQTADPSYSPIVRVAIVTARNAPSHKRVINTMRNWGISVNEAYFMGGVTKANVIDVLKPHMFFDDQKGHLTEVKNNFASVHVPFGIANNK